MSSAIAYRLLAAALLLASCRAIADRPAAEEIATQLRAGSYACRSLATLAELQDALLAKSDAQLAWMVGTACFHFKTGITVDEVLEYRPDTLRFALIDGRRRLHLWTDRDSLAANTEGPY